jgi:hypothetical protein
MNFVNKYDITDTSINSKIATGLTTEMISEFIGIKRGNVSSYEASERLYKSKYFITKTVTSDVVKPVKERSYTMEDLKVMAEWDSVRKMINPEAVG